MKTYLYFVRIEYLNYQERQQVTFAITAVTRDIGCINGDTIQEFAGDLIF